MNNKIKFYINISINILYNVINILTRTIENYRKFLADSLPRLPASSQRREISTVRFRDRLYRVYDARRINFKHGRKFERPTDPTNRRKQSVSRAVQPVLHGHVRSRLLVRTALVRGNLDLDYLQRILQSAASDVCTCTRARAHAFLSAKLHQNPAENRTLKSRS